MSASVCRTHVRKRFDGRKHHEQESVPPLIHVSRRALALACALALAISALFAATPGTALAAVQKYDITVSDGWGNSHTYSDVEIGSSGWTRSVNDIVSALGYGSYAPYTVNGSAYVTIMANTTGFTVTNRDEDTFDLFVTVTTTYPLWVGGVRVTEDNLSGEGWSYTPAVTEGGVTTPATLTLTDYSYEGEGHVEGNDSGAIYAKEDLTIIANGNNTVTNTGTAGAGIYVDTNHTNLTVGGSGTLSVTGNETNGVGISCNNVTIGGGTVEASGFLSGVFASKNITITGGTVDARSTSNTGKALQCSGVLRIESGTVDAAGGPNGNGVFGMAVEIKGGSVIATGSDGAIYGTVKNAVAGTGWTDVEGTQGKAAIEVNADPGQMLSAYKKVQFPAVVTKYTVAVKGGANATASGGATEQSVEEGSAMADVTYAPADGYHFEAFEAISADGVTAELKDGKVVVSGTPTADVEIAVPDAVKDAEPAPEVVPDASVAAHVQRIGWMDPVTGGAIAGTTGKSRRMEALTLKLPDGVAGGIEYRGHVQRSGWEKDWKADGAQSGTTGKSRRVEAVQIQLTGETKDAYDVYYRVHVQRYGWMAWAKNGEQAGTQGMSRRAEAIQVVLVRKDAPAPDATYKGVTQQYAKAFVKK